MITLLLSAAMVATIAAAYIHGHSAGMSQVYAEAEALAAKARRNGGGT